LVVSYKECCIRLFGEYNDPSKTTRANIILIEVCFILTKMMAHSEEEPSLEEGSGWRTTPETKIRGSVNYFILFYPDDG
jgi:hypothetical protein